MVTDIILNTLLSGVSKAIPYVPYWVKYLPSAGINTKERLAAYLAQVAHETGNFMYTTENMNYSAQALANTWPKRFAMNRLATPKVPNQIAKSLANKPEAIANNVYANRMGNGDENSGDGWKFRGRGLIQLTGRNSYKAYSFETYGDLRCVDDPDMLAKPEDAVRSSLWYWTTRDLNEYADDKDIKGMTKIINGGSIGLAHRTALYEKYLNTLT